MSDHFLNKLKSIRQRYGIEKSQNSFMKIEDKPSQTINRKNLSVNKKDTFRNTSQQISQKQRQSRVLYVNKKPQQSNLLIQRSQSFNKSPLNYEIQNSFQQRQISSLFNKKNSDRIFRQKDYNRPSKAYICNQPQCQSQQFSRTLSQRKTYAQNKYGLIYNYDENINTLPAKAPFSTQSIQREPLRISNRNLNVDNLNFNYDTLQKTLYNTVQSQRPPSMSCFTEKSSKPDWTLDKLCKVQQKIQAYLRR